MRHIILNLTLVYFTKPTPDFSISDVCEDNDAQFINKSTASANKLGYKWKFGDGLTSTLESPCKLAVGFLINKCKLFSGRDNGNKKGMTAFAHHLIHHQIKDVCHSVMTLKGINLAGGKAPQGKMHK